MPRAQQQPRRPAQQLTLWSAITGRAGRGKVKPAPVVTAPPARDVPLSEKAMPATGALVRFLGGTALYRLEGVMLCGPTCYVWLRQAGVADGQMDVAPIEALTLA